ncbi:MAG: hypothetical protein HC932_02495 [Thermales bacterium]|nr:hypothetical protein [Thermales bacterium]
MFGVGANAGTQTSIQTQYRDGVYSGNYSSSIDGRHSFDCSVSDDQFHDIFNDYHRAYFMRWFSGYDYYPDYNFMDKIENINGCSIWSH